MAKTPFELRNEVLAQRVVKNFSAVLLMPAIVQRRKKHWKRL